VASRPHPADPEAGIMPRRSVRGRCKITSHPSLTRHSRNQVFAANAAAEKNPRRAGWKPLPESGPCVLQHPISSKEYPTSKWGSGMDTGGVTAGSRRLSAATPPAMGRRMSAPRQGDVQTGGVACRAAPEWRYPDVLIIAPPGRWRRWPVTDTFLGVVSSRLHPRRQPGIPPKARLADAPALKGPDKGAKA
jgi:hypothetical protein